MLEAFDGAKDQDYSGTLDDRRVCMYAAFRIARKHIESQRGAVFSLEQIEAAIRSLVNPDNRTLSGIDCFQNMPVNYFVEEIRARLTPAQVSLQEKVEALMFHYAETGGATTKTLAAAIIALVKEHHD